MNLTYAQVIYVSSEFDLYRLDLATCDYEYVFSLPLHLNDLAFHPDGTFYDLEESGRLFIIDPNTGEHWIIHTFPGSSFTSLTAISYSRENT